MGRVRRTNWNTAWALIELQYGRTDVKDRIWAKAVRECLSMSSAGGMCSTSAYGNMYSRTYRKVSFGERIHFQGPAMPPRNRLPILPWPSMGRPRCKTFKAVSRVNMEANGLWRTALVMVGHTDTGRTCPYWLRTNVWTMMDRSRDFHSYEGVATNDYLEKSSFGLSPSPRTTAEGRITDYSYAEQQFGHDTAKGRQYYLQDRCSGSSKHKVRTFREVAKS